MSDKLTERERWLMRQASNAGRSRPDDWFKDWISVSQEHLSKVAPKPEPAWQPIETAPEGTMLLFCDMKATEVRHWCFVDYVADGLLMMSPTRMATHWMPLPEPPAPEPKILIDAMDAWTEEQGTGIDEGKA